MAALLAAFLIIAILVIVIRFYEKNTNALCKSNKRLKGKTTLITGGTAGMGLEIAKDFARRGARVIIACPFQEEGVNARETIIQKTGHTEVVFKLLDLSSLKSVRKFAEDILATEERLDILINNAGVGVPEDFLTQDGMSFIMQVNYFGHFLLTLLLLPLLKKSGTPEEPSRVVNTSSILHIIGAYQIRDLNKIDPWFYAQTYGKSKICLVYFARELTKRLKGSNVVINSVDPGAVGTGIFYSAGKVLGAICTIFFRNVYKTPREGAQTALHVALDQEAGKVSGEFFKNCKQTKAIKYAYIDKIAKWVWDQSIELVKLNKEEYEHC